MTKWFERKQGISVLVACQNEEAVVASSIRSFLTFADEIIVVDNGSTDQSRRIARGMEERYPSKVQFFDVPHLADLYQNRQYALERSTYRWIVRADADFVAYDEGPFDIMRLREQLLQDQGWMPAAYGAPLPNLNCDFWHTGVERPPEGLAPDAPGRYVAPPITKPTLRIYKAIPGFRFKRLGRWEGTSFNRVLHWMRSEWPHPWWMHCNLKSDLSTLFRSERTNWRELGDFQRYPRLVDYVRAMIPQKYGTEDLKLAAEAYMKEYVYPFLQTYDPERFYPYPRLVIEQMATNPVYRIVKNSGEIRREYYGVHI